MSNAFLKPKISLYCGYDTPLFHAKVCIGLGCDNGGIKILGQQRCIRSFKKSSKAEHTNASEKCEELVSVLAAAMSKTCCNNIQHCHKVIAMLVHALLYETCNKEGQDKLVYMLGLPHDWNVM